MRLEAQDLARLALGLDFKRTAAHFAIGGKPLLGHACVDSQLKGLATERTLNCLGHFHSGLLYHRVGHRAPRRSALCFEFGVLSGLRSLNLTASALWIRMRLTSMVMPNPLRVLIIEDSVDDTFFIVRELQRAGYNVDFERVETPAGMQSALQGRTWDLIISDFSMPRFGGAAALALYLQSGQDMPFILVSGTMGEEIAVEMVKAGAHHYVMKDNLAKLVPAVSRELQAAEQRRIYREIEAAQAYLASIVSSCHDAIIGKTLQGIVVSWNSGAEKLYGYTAEEMLGQSFTRLIPQYRPEELAETMDRIRNNEQIEQLETVRLRKDGTPVEVSVVISAIKDRNGQIIGASSVSRDISLRKQEENERLALIQELTAALSHSRP